jgi:hypothetical protein
MENPSRQFSAMAGRSPEEAKFFWTGGPIEVAERTWFPSLFSGAESEQSLMAKNLFASAAAYARAGRPFV